MQSSPSAPGLSVIVLNFNGARWIERCLKSIASQTIFNEIQVIVADNRSEDGSDRRAAELIARWSNGIFIQHHANLGFCEGNNSAAQNARGEYLFFLNNDT